MNFKILNVILYPRDQEKIPRIITFDTQKINIITGYSQRGKSALIDIIDYCLGSGECNIPVGKIRKKTLCYGLYIQLEGENLFLARENFEDSQSIMYWYRETVTDKNIELRSNEWLKDKGQYKTNVRNVKQFLSEKAGFRKIVDESSKMEDLQIASFRDTAAFQFQPQSIIANPSTMFFKTETWEHMQKLKTIFPLILGYSSYDIIETKNKISKIENERNELLKKAQNLKDQYSNWRSDIYLFYSEALSFGMTNQEVDIETSSIELLQEVLNDVVMRSKKGELFKRGSSANYNKKANELINKRDGHLRQLSLVKNEQRKIVQAYDVRNNLNKNVLKEKQNRLRPVEWFLNQQGSNICPLCDSESDNAINRLISLNEVKKENSKAIKKLNSIELNFDKEIKEVTAKIVIIENSISQIDRNLDIILKEIEKSERSYQKAFEFVGKVDHALNNLEKIKPSGELNSQIDLLSLQLSKLQRELRELKQKFDKAATLNTVTTIISKYIKVLPVEDKSNRKVFLDPDVSLNIKIEDTSTNNKYYLSRLGSGANYMSYHLATLFGLHEFFNRLKKKGKPNYVPTFLILDQPSQVYYPDDFNKKEKRDLETSSNDIVDTKSIFKACETFLKNTNSEIQLILLEHVPSSLWEDIDPNFVNLVEEWRDEVDNGFNALIPEDW